jgi:hypothetical protein
MIAFHDLPYHAVPLVPWYLVPWYYQVVRTHVRTTLSQKPLELQALKVQRGNCGRCQHKRRHSTVPFQLDSDVCSADLHHNPRKHVGLHAHQRLHRTRVLARVPWYGVYTCVPWYRYVRNVYVLLMLCHNFLIGKGHTCALRTTCVFCTYVRVRTYRGTYVRALVHVFHGTRVYHGPKVPMVE